MSVDARAAQFITNCPRYRTGYSRVFVISTAYTAAARSLPKCREYLLIGKSPAIFAMETTRTTSLVGGEYPINFGGHHPH